MEACEAVRFFVNEAVAPKETRGEGNPDYGSLRVVVAPWNKYDSSCFQAS
jgi:hypothetical protein